MLEMGTVVMGRGIAFASPCGNHIAVFKGDSSRQADSTWAQNALRTGPCRLHPFRPRLRASKRIPSIRRLAAWLAARASDPKAGLWLVTGFAAVHAVLWTLILVNLKAGQDVHMDVAEAYAWGQKFLLGYGKHPPLSGWVAGVWFRLFPVTDWATYALAMATLGLRARDLLAAGAARGRSPPRVLRRGDAGALSDLQLQGLQVQSGPAAARHAAAGGAGLSRCVREAQREDPACGSGLPARWR